MKIVWILVALLCAGACGVLGFLLANRKPVYPQVTSPRTIPGADQDDIIESYLKVDPKLIIAKEDGRLSTGLKELRAIAVGPDDRVYAAGDKCFEIFGADGKIASKVDLDKTPTCIATDADSTVYVGVWDHVEVFSSKGAKIATWEKPGPSAWLTSLAVSDKNVYAADFGDKTVIRYDRKGKIQGRLGEPGKIEGTGKYEIPSPYFDVAVDAHGAPWVAHTGRRLLETYNEDGSLAGSWGKSGPQIEKFSGCCNPSHIAIRKDGSFVTSEKGLVRVKIHASNGDLVGVVAAAKDFEKGIHGLDLAVDSKDRILVADPGTASVRIYSLKGGESHP
ncbi:MAG TPA: NHL repeat-containing protein [Planctomycetota bacterium]|nr:NHL repeat-containing protein [Planctomycetota bacterium]